jgi:hypothetical protein
MSTVVTELVIDADTSGADKFSQSMDKASGSAQQGINSAAGLTLAIAGVGVAFIGALAGLRSFFDYVGNQNKQLIDIAENARNAGMSAREFQETLFAARSKGLTEKDFVSGLDKITTSLTEASSGITKFGRLFKDNEISIKNQNGELKNSKQALADIAGLMQNASPVVQQGIAKIVGLSKEWIPFLRDGADAIEKQKKAATDLGVIIGDDVIEKAKVFDTQWKTAIATWDLQFKASLADILPLMVKLANLASTVLEGIGGASSSVSRWMTPDDNKSKAQLNDQINDVARLRDMMDSLAQTGGELKKFKVANLAELVGLSGDATIKDVDALLTKLSALYDKKPTAITVGAVGSTVLPANDNKDALDREIDRLQKHIAVTLADTEAVGQSEAAQAGLRAEATLYAAAERAGFTDLEKFAEKFMKIREQVESTTAALKQAQAEGNAKFNFETIGLSDTEKQIATIQRQLHGDDWKAWMNDGLASTIRLTDNLKLVSDSLKDVGKAAFSAALQGKLGMDGLVSTLDNVAKKLSDKAFENLLTGALSGDPVQMAVGAAQAGVSALITAFTGDQKAKKALEEAQTRWHDMAGQMSAFSLAAKGINLGPLTSELNSLFSTVETLQKAAQAAHDRSGEAQAATMFNNAVSRIFTQFKEGNQVLTPLQQQMKAVNDEAEGLKETLLQISPGFSGLADQIDGIRQGQIDDVVAKFHDTFISGLTTRLNAAKGQGFLNDTANLLLAHAQDLASVKDLGNDPTLLSQVATTFRAEAQKIVDDAQLIGTAFYDFTTQFPILKDVVHEFTQSAVDDSKALRDAQNSAAKTVTDYLNSLVAGPSSTQSPIATLASAQTLYQANLPLAQGGSIDAQNKFVSLADNLEKAARAVYASGTGYQDIRNQIINQGLNLPAVQATTDPVTAAVRDAITAIQIGNAALNIINATAGGTTGAINAANSNIAGAVGGTTSAVNSSNSVGTLTGVILPAVNAGNAVAVAANLASYFNNLNAAQNSTTGAVNSGNSIASGQIVPAVNAGNAASTAAALTGLFNQIDPTGTLSGILVKTDATAQHAYQTTVRLGPMSSIANNTVSTKDAVDATKGSVDSNNSLTAASNSFLTSMNTFSDRIIQALNSMGASITNAINALRGDTAVLINWTAKAGMNDPSFNAGYGVTGAAPYIPRALGGWITGGIPGRDSVPIMAMQDEFMVNRNATRALTQQFGSGVMDIINSGRLPFNDNGRPLNVVAPVFRGGGGGDNGSNAALLAEVKRLNEKIDRLEKVVAGSAARGAQATVETGERIIGATDRQTEALASVERQKLRARA